MAFACADIYTYSGDYSLCTRNTVEDAVPIDPLTLEPLERKFVIMSCTDSDSAPSNYGYNLFSIWRGLDEGRKSVDPMTQRPVSTEALEWLRKEVVSQNYVPMPRSPEYLELIPEDIEPYRSASRPQTPNYRLVSANSFNWSSIISRFRANFGWIIIGAIFALAALFFLSAVGVDPAAALNVLLWSVIILSLWV